MNEPSVRNHVALARQYALDVVEGRQIAGLYIVLACQRFLDDLQVIDGPYHFDEQAAARPCKFIELLPHVKGQWSARGEKIVLEPWHCFAVCNIFGWLDEYGYRRYREVYWEVARKNAKTTIAAAIGLFCLILDNEAGAEVYSGATSEKQAMEVFGVARRMCKLSPDLVKEFGVNVRVGSLLVEDTFSKFLPIIRDPGDGSSPSCYIVDEFHEHGDPRQYNSMTTGMDAREQPLTLIITTAGHNQAGPCFQRRGFHLEALQGSVNVPDLFTLVYTLDKEDDWTDFETNRKANPNLGVSVIESQLRLQHQHAIQNHERQGSYKTKKCNLWTGAATTFLNLASWNAAPARPDWDDMQGRRCFLGADLASKIDLAALVALFPPDDEFDFWCAYFHYWSSEDYLAQVQNAHLSVWKNEGLVYECPGARIDLEEIVDEVRDIRTHVEVAEFCYDPYHATQLATSTSGEGIVAVEVQMHVKYLSPAMRELEALNNEGKLAHGGDACTTWQAGNLQASEDRKDNVFPRKGSSERKIDGMVALLLALFRAAQPPEEPEQSIYNTRGMRSI